MIKPIAIALIALSALSLTACITVEIPAPEYPELPEMDELSEASDAADKASDAVSVGAKLKSAVSVTERSTPRPANTPLPAATVQPANHRPDTSQIVIIRREKGEHPNSIRGMFNAYENNIHLAEKLFDGKWLWFTDNTVGRVERNRIVIYASSGGNRELHAKFPPGAGLEEVGGYIHDMVCFDATYSKRNSTITVSDCEIIDSLLDLDD